MITRKQFIGTIGGALAAPAFSLQTARQTRPKNVLVLMSDQHHPRAMGCMGDTQTRTPNLDALAARSTSFRSAYCSNPVCGPSRASILTGLCTHHHGVVKNDIPWRNLPTVAHHFTRAGVPGGLDEPSLTPFLKDPARRQDRPVYSDFPWAATPMGDTPELYNLREDPLEMNNLASTRHEIAAKFEKELLAWRKG